LSGVIHGLAIAIIVLTLAPLAAQVPLAALAGILMVTSIRMIEWEAIGLLMRATYADFAVSIARINLLVKQTFTRYPLSRQESIVASARPRSLRGTSTHPVNLLSTFQRL
jgi:peptidoglycan biosynthesis protein MviN/MurJ (putative lipid II flippase)